MIFEQNKQGINLDKVMDALYALSSSIFVCTVSSSVRISWWFTQWVIVSVIYKLYNVYCHRESFIEVDKKNLIFCAFCLSLFFFAMSSSLWAEDSNVAFSFSHKRMSPLAMITLMILIMPRKVPTKLLLQSFIVGSFLFIFNDFYEVIKNGLEHDIKFLYYDLINHFDYVIIECWERRINHVFTGPTLFSSIFVIVYLLKSYKSTVYEKIFYGFYVLIATPFILFDCSRGCVLGLLISLFILALVNSKFSIKRLTYILCGGVVLLILLMLIPSRFSESMTQLLLHHEFHDPRFHIWDSLIKAADKVPFLGYGISNQTSHYYEAFIANGKEWCSKAGFGSHNQFIGYFYELGIIGVILFIAVIAGYIKFFVVKNKYTIITLPFIVMFVVSSLFDNAMQSYYATMALMFFPFICSIKEEKTVELPNVVYSILEVCIVSFMIWCGISVCKIVDFMNDNSEVIVSDLRHFRLRKSQERQFNLTDEQKEGVYYFFSNKSETDMWYESFGRFSSLIARVKSGNKHKLSFDYFVSSDYTENEMKVTTQRTSSFVDIACDSIMSISYPPHVTSHYIDVTQKEKWLHFESSIDGGEQYIRLEVPKTDAYMIHRINGFVIIRNLKIEKK